VVHDQTQKPHDVLAAEEFVVPAPDPALHQEPLDVLAAEEFVVPAPDPALHHEDLHGLPSDLVGEEPQEVLAAEEFAMPSPDEAHQFPAPKVVKLQYALPGALAAGVAAAVILGKFRRR